MNLSFTERGFDHYVHWQSTDKKILKKINQLLRDIKRSPYDGLGKPELLKNEMSGLWSRRITQEHRLVYRVSGNEVHIIACLYHYDEH